MKSNHNSKFLIHNSQLPLLCDPVGIRTRDPQLRRLLLYPAELPDPRVRQSRAMTVALRHWALEASALTSKLRASRYFFALTMHEITHVGTQNRAYKGNLGAKVLLFSHLCKYFCKNLQNSYKSSSKSFCKSGLRIAPT